MKKYNTIGVDLAKNVIHVCVVLPTKFWDHLHVQVHFLQGSITPLRQPGNFGYSIHQVNFRFIITRKFRFRNRASCALTSSTRVEYDLAGWDVFGLTTFTFGPFNKMKNEV